MKRFILISIIILFQIVLFSQNKFLDKANEAYNLYKYSKAIELFKKGYSKLGKDREAKAQVMFKIAMCYKKQNDVRRARAWFKRAIRYDYKDPKALLHYADVLKMLGDYEEALIEYNNYKEKNPTDTLVNKDIESCLLAKKWIENPTRYEVEPMRRISARESDFCPDYADSKYRTLIFTSTRDGATGSDTDAWTGENFSDLFFVRKDRKRSWRTPIPFSEAINTEDNEGSGSLNENGTVIYFTRCQVEKKKQMGCQIYKSVKTGKVWQDAEIVQVVDDTSIIVGHPALSPDESELYFVADMKGGYGKKDIWVVDISGNSIGEPENLGPAINTPEDEMFPYVANDGTLYFSSRGHLGMGGLDIFKSTFADGEWSEPENMKYPINSSYDDFGIVLENTNDAGFFSTNRKGGRGSDDIWSLKLPPLVFTLQGVVKDDSTKQVMNEVIVKIIGSDGSSYIDYTDENGKYFFNEMQILPNTTYEISATQKGYFTEKGKETTVGIQRNKDIEHDFFLKRIPDKPIELPEILYDFAKWNLKPQYQDSLNGLIQTLKDNPRLVIELASHTDSRASLEYNDTLSQKRAQSVVDYLIEKGIAPARLMAKGYGERVPKVLREKVVYPGKTIRQGTFIKKDTVISGVKLDKGLVYSDIVIDSVVFEKGTELNEEFIESLDTKREKELAHQLNRRTEFRVISENYVPKENKDLEIPEIEIINEGKEEEEEQD